MFRVFTIIALALTLVPQAFCMGQQSSPDTKTTQKGTMMEISEVSPEASPAAQKATLTGVIRMVGNEPFTRLVLTSEDKTDYYLQIKKLPFLIDLQGKNVKITGLLTSKSTHTANRKFITEEHSLIPEEITYQDTLDGTFKLTKTGTGPTASLLVTTRGNSREYTLQLTPGQSYDAYQNKQVEIVGTITIRLSFNAQGSYESGTFFLRPQSIKQLDRS